MSDIVKAIRQIVKSMVNPDLLQGTVKSFDGDSWTIVVELNQGATVDDVSIRSVLDDGTTGIFIEPKIGSSVLCGMTDGRIENLKVILFSEIENMEMMPKDTLKLRGDQHGGLLILKKVEENLNSIKQYCESMKTSISSGLNAVGAGTAANGAAGATAFNSAMASKSINFQDMENKKVTHG